MWAFDKSCWIYVLTGTPYTGYNRRAVCVKLFGVVYNLPEVSYLSVYNLRMRGTCIYTPFLVNL